MFQGEFGGRAMIEHDVSATRLLTPDDDVKFTVARHLGALGQREAPWYIIRRLRNTKIGVPV